MRSIGPPAEVFYGDPSTAPATVRVMAALGGIRPVDEQPVRYGEALAALRRAMGTPS